MTTPPSPSRRDLINYGFMAVPLSFAGLPLYIHAPDFYATQAGLGLAAIGAAIMAIRVFDALQDPVIGYLSNRGSRYRMKIIAASSVAMAAAFFMLFHPPSSHTLAWFVVSFVLTTMAFSFLSININALGSLWSDRADHKTRITVWREGMGLAGIILAATLPGIIGFHLYSAVLALLLALGFLLLSRWGARAQTSAAWRELPASFKGREILQGLPWGFFMVYLISMMASSIPAVLVLFFIRDYLGAGHLTGLFLLLYFLSGALGMPLWLKISARTDQARAWFLAMIVATLTFVWACLLQPGNLWSYGFICVLSGFALGAELALPPAILSRLIDMKGQQNKTSYHFALLSFLSKISLAVGTGVSFLILGTSSFTPGTANDADTLRTLALTYALLPCVVKAAAAGGLFLWIRLQSNGGLNAYSSRGTAGGGRHGS